MQSLRGSFLILFLIFLSNQVLAAEVVQFPKKRNSRNFCHVFLAATSFEGARTGRSAEIIQIESYRSEYISPKEFLKIYPIGESVFNPSGIGVYTLAPKVINDYNPAFNSYNFSKWRPLDSHFRLSSQQETYILMGFSPRNEKRTYANNAFSKGTASEYQNIMTQYTPAHHTNFVVPKLYRLLLSTIEHVRATSSYLLNENLARTEAFEIDFTIIFTRDNVKYGARDFVSSWKTNNSLERQLQEFLIRFIDLKVNNLEESVYEKTYFNEILNELRQNYKTSSEVSNSLENLENELMSILRLSKTY